MVRFDDLVGYVVGRQHPVSRAWLVVYLADEQGVDVGGARYVVVCEKHHVMVGSRSLSRAKKSMMTADFCEECTKVIKNG